MLPTAVFPLHCKDGLLLDHLEKILPDLKIIFNKIIISVTPLTLELQKGRVEKLAKDTFLATVYNSPRTQVGDHFLSGLNKATEVSRKNDLLHLCTLDRLSFALETGYRDQFVKDILWAENQRSPVLFQRSKKAWATHPKNYFAIESAATRMGEILFGKTLDFTWCHLAIRSEELKEILPAIKAHDFTFMSKIVLELKDKLTTKDVDWLSWEDPYILGKDFKTYKQERENSAEENEKRLNYIIPTVKTLLEYKQLSV